MEKDELLFSNFGIIANNIALTKDPVSKAILLRND